MDLRRLQMIIYLILIILYNSFESEADIYTSVDHNESQRSMEEIRWLFEDWAVRYDKYYNEIIEKEHRFQVFKENLRFIEEHNHIQNNHSYIVDLNHFADLRSEEFRNIYLSARFNVTMTSRFFPPSSDQYMVMNGENLPESVDWRAKGAVTSVKHQGHCGSCWAFSTIATIEGINQIVTGKLIDLSEQQLVDCNNKNWGCNGGWPETAFAYIRKNGIDTEGRYPYKGTKANCNRNTAKAVSIDGYYFTPRYNEGALRKAVASQPISVIIRSDSRAFQFYKSGIYNGPCGMDLDHAVTVVGYDMDPSNGKAYWIVKNSWGQGWGEEGYVRIERNVKSYDGKCGITAYPAYPIKNRKSHFNFL
ncbi:unnamed protein product [Spirodela intermedia]|uniref:Uncharacterized protein n=1 Tax=Spirodela intermedia TaxID=51605 RepID=A0A7I8JK79_SPIIN|nr:unnamed protein product [Spirodela intermedia]CAA6669852.1 unnamed protein product [Spirodela intermedia]